jgi:hypothetical protein
MKRVKTMLVVFGVASLVICALLVVIGRAAFVNPTCPAAARRFATSAAYHVFLATFAGTGVVLLLLFLTGTTGLGGLHIALSAAIDVAGVFAVRVVHRRAVPAEHEIAA